MAFFAQALGDIQIAVKAMQEEAESLEHPVDKHYRTLHCDLMPLDHEHDDFKVGLLSCTNVQFQKKIHTHPMEVHPKLLLGGGS